MTRCRRSRSIPTPTRSAPMVNCWSARRPRCCHWHNDISSSELPIRLRVFISSWLHLGVNDRRTCEPENVAMTVVEHVYRASALPRGTATYARDTIALGWEERLHAHGRRASAGGREFGLALPRGTILRAGDCLVLDGEHV